MSENQEGKVILEYGSKGFENEYSKLTKLSKLLRTFQNNYIKINHNIEKSVKKVQLANEGATKAYEKTVMAHLKKAQKSELITAKQSNEQVKTAKELANQTTAIKGKKSVLNEIQLQTQLKDSEYQVARALEITESKKQSIIDSTTRINAELANTELLEKNIRASNDLQLAKSKINLQYKIEHRKELRQQAKEEKKINDYINGRNPGLEKALSTVKKTAKKVLSLHLAWKAVKKTVNFLLKANEPYANFMETLNLAEVSFQNNAEAVVSWSKDYADSLGLSYNEVLKFASSLKSLTDTMGIADDVGTKMSTTLTTLIYNIASLRNLDFGDAYSKIESTIFSGQLRTARTIGVDISVASMQALVEELGYAEIEYKNLTEAQKVQLRTIKVLRDLGSQSAGDLEKTLASTSNRLRILKSSWENLLTVIGNATNTVFSDLLAYVIGAVQGLSRFIQDLKPLAQSTGLNNTAKAMNLVEDGIEGVNEQLGLLQIDKFETLAGAGDKKNSYSFDSNVDEELDKYNKLNETMQNIDETVKNVSDRFYEMFQSIDKETFREFADTLGDIVLKLPELVTGLVKVITNITNLFLKLYESNMLIPLIVSLGTALLGFKILMMSKSPLGVILGASFLLGGAFASGDAIKTAKSYNASEALSSIGGTSKANGSASTALQRTQFGSTQPIRVGLDINGREFASAVYNDFNYTNQRYTGASLGGN